MVRQHLLLITSLTVSVSFVKGRCQTKTQFNGNSLTLTYTQGTQNRNSRQTKRSVLPRPEHSRMDSWLYFSVFSVASVAKKSQCKSVFIFSILTVPLFKGRFSGLP